MTKCTLYCLIWWTVRNEIVAFILANGGTDEEDSQFLFHFQAYRDIMRMREGLRVNVADAFHAPGEDAVVQAWIVVVKTADYSEDRAFFVDI